MIRSRKRRPTLAALVLGLVAGTVPALSGPALASHVDSVTVAPPVAAVPQDTCEPIVVTTSGGTNPQDALVDVEVRSTEILLNEAAADVTFCLPGGPEIINPVDIDPTTGDLGVGSVDTDGIIGG